MILVLLFRLGMSNSISQLLLQFHCFTHTHTPSQWLRITNVCFSLMVCRSEAVNPLQAEYGFRMQASLAYLLPVMLKDHQLLEHDLMGQPTKLLELGFKLSKGLLCPHPIGQSESHGQALRLKKGRWTPPQREGKWWAE